MESNRPESDPRRLSGRRKGLRTPLDIGAILPVLRFQFTVRPHARARTRAHTHEPTKDDLNYRPTADWRTCEFTYVRVTRVPGGSGGKGGLNNVGRSQKARICESPFRAVWRHWTCGRGSILACRVTFSKRSTNFSTKRNAEFALPASCYAGQAVAARPLLQFAGVAIWICYTCRGRERTRERGCVIRGIIKRDTCIFFFFLGIDFSPNFRRIAMWRAFISKTDKNSRIWLLLPMRLLISWYEVNEFWEGVTRRILKFRITKINFFFEIYNLSLLM